MTKIIPSKHAAKRPRRMAREPISDAPEQTAVASSSAAPAEPKSPRQTKATQVEEILTSDGGASLDQLCNATGWQPHTCRAFLTGLRKKGKDIDRSKRDDGVTIYRLNGVSVTSKKDAA